MNNNPIALLPELLLLAGAVAALLTGSFVPRHRQGVTGLIAAAALTGCIIAALLGRTDQTVYDHSYAVDVATTTARVIAAGAALLIIVLATPRVTGDRRQSEFSVLVLLATLGAVVMAGAADLMLLAAGFLLATIPLYGLAGWGRDPRGAEGALKLYLLGALAGVIMLGGVTLLYAAAGATGYPELRAQLSAAPAGLVTVGIVGVLAGLLFKAGAVPMHFWVPDTVQGATTGAAAMLTTVPKVGALIAAYRLVEVVPAGSRWPIFVAVVAAVTMTLGNLAAFAQTSVHRLLAYSTISQVGYLLMAVAVAGTGRALPALLAYLAGYAVTNVGAFAVVAAEAQRTSLRDYRGLARSRPLLTAALTICLLGLVGTPPTAVFLGKVSVFSAAWDGGMAWLVVLAAVNTAASVYYYLRWLLPAFTAARSRPQHPSPTRWARAPAAVAVLAAGGALILGLAGGPLLDITAGALVR